MTLNDMWCLVEPQPVKRDTLCAARAARAILWNDERCIPLKDFVEVSQTSVTLLPSDSILTSYSVVDFFSNSSLPPHVAVSLIKYYSLLHYTSISHATLSFLFPIRNLDSNGPSSDFVPSACHALLSLLSLIPSTIFHPRFLVFFPPLMCHAPAYLTGHFAARFLAPPGEEEAKAQFKGLIGGLCYGTEYTGIAWRLVKWLVMIGKGEKVIGWGDWPWRFETGPLTRLEGLGNVAKILGKAFANTVTKLGRVVAGGHAMNGQAWQLFTLMVAFYGIAWVLFRWHNALVDSKWTNILHRGHILKSRCVISHAANLRQ
jgi:glycerol-3-phosphate O-acyltransferase/dihydroxyacetone phosphate acyltransferase